MFKNIKVYLIIIRTFVCFQRKKGIFQFIYWYRLTGQGSSDPFQKKFKWYRCIRNIFCQGWTNIYKIFVKFTCYFILTSLYFVTNFKFPGKVWFFTIYLYYLSIFKQFTFFYVMFELEYLLWVAIFLDFFLGKRKNNSGWTLQNLKNCYVRVSVKKHLERLRSIHQIRTPKRLCC